MPVTNNPDFWLALARGDTSAANLSEHIADTELLLSLAGLSEREDTESLPAPGQGRAQTLDLRFLRELAGLPKADFPTSVYPPPAGDSLENDVEKVEEPQHGIAKFEDAREPETPEDLAAVPHADQPATIETEVEQIPEQVLLDEPVEESVSVVEELDGPATEPAVAVPEKPRRFALPTALRVVLTILAVVATLAVGFVARGFWSAPAQDNRTAAQGTAAEHQQQDADSKEQLFSAITRAVGDSQAYLRALKAYAEQFPGTSRANDFEAVLASGSVIWDDVQQWNDLVEQMTQQRLAGLDAQGADELRKQIRLEQTRWANFPGSIT